MAQLVAAGSFIVMDQEEVVLSNTGEGAVYLEGCVGQSHKRPGMWPQHGTSDRHMATKQQYKHAKDMFVLGSMCERMQDGQR